MADALHTIPGPGVEQESDDHAETSHEDEQSDAPVDPHPDDDDDFEGEDGGRQSEEAIPEKGR